MFFGDPSSLRIYEISDRINNYEELIHYLHWLLSTGARMVGFNNVGFDYPVIHDMINGKRRTAADVYALVDYIINSEDRFSHIVWDRDRFIPQVDLFKIHHFDNKARSTSLKMLEFNMRSDDIQELPYTPGSYLQPHEIDKLRSYNVFDVVKTADFLKESLNLIEFRDELSNKYGRDFTNYNDTKIGKEYFKMRLEEALPGCTKHQTPRDFIRLNDVIFDYVKFEHPEFQRILQYFRDQVIVETKGVFDDLHATIDGFTYHFGVGGIHGSIESATVEADDRYCIVDIDVTSYYPSLAIENNLYPAHLGPTFVDIYRDIKEQRVGYAKGTPENAMLKLALNGVYGASNDIYSPFYDPLFTMAITINGQLLLCMFAEWVTSKVEGLTMIQANTDGITVKLPKFNRGTLTYYIKEWEKLTGLQLEQVLYSRMFIRDVNNYLAETTDGKLKNKGAYEYDINWAKNFSQLVVPKCAESALVNGEDINAYITDPSRDKFDFMLRTKVPRSSRLVAVDSQGNETEQQRITRFYVANEGVELFKIMPPTPAQIKKWRTSPQLWHMLTNDRVCTTNQKEIDRLKRKGYIDTPENMRVEAPERRIAICKGHKVKVCNNMNDYDPTILNYHYYITETRKLVDPLR
jgi:hypothetical protein